MELTEDAIIQKYGKNCGHCNRKTLLPYEYEYRCFSCGFNLVKRKHELTEIQRKRKNFINRLKYAEQKMFCICIDFYKSYESNDYDKIYEVLSTLRNKKLKISFVLIEKNKNMRENLDFEQNSWSRTVEGIYKIGQDSIRRMN